MTFCGVFQFEGVKVRLVGDGVTSTSPELRAMLTVTFAAGAIASLTVNVAFDPSFTFIEVVDGTMF
jgi:hypothetical protein